MSEIKTAPCSICGEQTIPIPVNELKLCGDCFRIYPTLNPQLVQLTVENAALRSSLATERQRARWIPIEERLPSSEERHDNSGWFLATLENGFRLEMHYNGLRWATRGNIGHYDVIAWMNFPKAYAPEGVERDG